MRLLVIFAGSLLLVAGLVTGYAARDRAARKNVALAQTLHETRRLNEELKACAVLERTPPKDIFKEAYAGFINDIYVIGRSEHTACTVIVPGMVQGDMRRAVEASPWAGVQQLPLNVHCTGLQSRSAFFSMLRAFSGIEEKGTAVIRRIKGTKDTLEMEVIIVGLQEGAS